MKKKIIGFLVCAILLLHALPVTSYTDNKEVEKEIHLTRTNDRWIKTYGGLGSDSCYSIQQTDDGGILLLVEQNHSVI